MTTQQQIDIEFDSLARENDSPKLIANSKATGGTLLSVIKGQLSTCSSFDFCVAFVADGGLQILVEAFQELKQRGIKGRLLTSTYLNFNSPDAFRKLLEYDNIEVRVFQGNLHAKGYIFDKGETSTVIVGSSNMTQTALTCNKEWNVLYQTVENSRLLGELRGEFDSLWNDTSTVLLSQDWIENYAVYRMARPPKTKSKSTFKSAETPAQNDLVEIKPIQCSSAPSKRLERSTARARLVLCWSQPQAQAKPSFRRSTYSRPNPGASSFLRTVGALSTPRAQAMNGSWAAPIRSTPIK